MDKFFNSHKATLQNEKSLYDLYEEKVRKFSNDSGDVNFSALFSDMKSMFMQKVASSDEKIPSQKPMMMEKLMQNLELNHEKVQWKANESDDPLLYAFDDKKNSHTSAKSTMVPPMVVPYAIDLLSHVIRTSDSAIYINVPFCQTRCAFCMFYINSYKKEESARYTDALIKEIEMWAQTNSVKNTKSRKFSAVYLGGGTPTSLEAEDLGRIIKAVKDNFDLSDNCEITVEGRISYFTEEKILSCLKNGATRFSLGVQSFDTDLRQSLGRISTKEELIKGLLKLKKICAPYNAAVIIDLIFGLPGQDMKTFEDDLKTTAELPIDGVDLYQIIMLEGAPMTKLIKANKLSNAPDRFQRAKMYKKGCEYLIEKGFVQLSCAHFARSNLEKNIYNVLAKSQADILAFGPGAGGKIQGVSYMNVRTYEDWIEKIQHNKKTASMMFISEKNWKTYKKISEQMDLGYIDFCTFSNLFKTDIYEKLKEVIDQWESTGLLIKNETGIKLTLAGRFHSVRMTQILIDYMQEKEEENTNSDLYK